MVVVIFIEFFRFFFLVCLYFYTDKGMVILYDDIDTGEKCDRFLFFAAR